MSQDLPRYARLLAGTVALSVGVSSALLFSAAGPAAAASGPRAQSVGRFLDGQLGPQTLQDVLDVQDARATNPGSVSDQNPLSVNVAKSGELPLGSAPHPPQLTGVTFGAVNQVAVAKSNGYSYGASGAVRNSGAVSTSGGSPYPANATFDLSAKGLAGNSPIPIPGGGSADALGGITATIGAVSALASTPVGVHKRGSTQYNIGALSLTIGSPALGQLLSTLAGALNPSALDGLLSALPVKSLPVGGVPTTCNLTKALLPSSLSLAGGAITISATNGSLSVDLAKLLAQSGANLNSLPANTDLLDYLTHFLASPSGLAKGLQNAISSATDDLQNQFADCAAALPGFTDALNTLNGGKAQLQAALNGLLGSVAGAGGSGDPLAPLADGLKKVLDIGVNVQPNGKAGSFASSLKATPDQATPVVAGQTIVRALEINLIPAAGSSPAATLALANAAAGPSNAVEAAPPTVTPTTSAPAGPPDTQLPTGVPAGSGTRGGPPTTPLVLLALGVALAGAGAIAWRLRIGRYGA
jgi:hypothetical protein